MRQGRVFLSVVLLASACVDVTINNRERSDDAGTTGCNLGGPNGGAAPGSDGSTFRTPRPTDSITMRGNLDQTSAVQRWDATSPRTTGNFVTTVTVYDSLGKAIQLDIYFSKIDVTFAVPGDSGDWTYHVMTDGGNLDFQSDGTTPGFPGQDTEIAAGTLRFDNAGRLISNTEDGQGFYPKNAHSPQVLTFNFGTGTDSGGSGLDGITQYAATSGITFVDQSGSAFAP